MKSTVSLLGVIRWQLVLYTDIITDKQLAYVINMKSNDTAEAATVG